MKWESPARIRLSGRSLETSLRERVAVLTPWPAGALPVIVGCWRGTGKEWSMGAPTVFICYSRKDKWKKEKVVNHLSVLGKQGLLDVWDDQRIGAGQDWFAKIQEAMQRARVAILLISHNFLISNFILREELPKLLERREKEGMKIVPILLSYCDWQAVDWLAAMQMRPDPEVPLESLRGGKVNSELTKIVREVRELLASPTPNGPDPASVTKPPDTDEQKRDGGVRPEWAADWGRDPFGAWAAFQVGGVTQKLRWIPPGKFLMGSPDHEEGRWDDEGPQHEVAIESGFWMFETPCTQALWEAVMGQNPSHIRGPTRPVEQVSWDDAQAFLTRIAAMVPGLRLGLPSEEQWEYACRAGSAAARYGDLDQIAWYSENSGGETHPVALKQPNGWGLHDMLGNVWEWCADAYWEYGTGKRGASAPRVIRGGSWSGVARVVRAACRGRNGPSFRFNDLGFRWAELRQGVVSGARQGSEAEGAEQPGDRDPTSAAARPREDDGLSAQSD